MEYINPILALFALAVLGGAALVWSRPEAQRWLAWHLFSRAEALESFRRDKADRLAINARRFGVEQEKRLRVMAQEPEEAA